MVFLIFFTRIHTPPPPLLILLSRNQHLRPTIPGTAFLSKNPTPPLPRRIQTNSRRWDSNAETFRTQNFNFDDDDEFDDDDDDDANQWLDILEDFIDGVWIFKVFRSFGWMLPAIISSLLLTSGPKAFLMALAIPVAQSALSFIFQTVWGRPKNKTKRRGKSKRRAQPPPPRSPPRAARYGGVYTKESERKSATEYETWVAGDRGSGSGSSDEKTGPSFGGWEELDGSNQNWSNINANRKSKLSRRERRSETPLLLRLLIAVFPFLGSWTRLL